VNYTDVNGNTVVERYTAVPAADAADVSSASLVLGIAQPDINHNGGMLLFGPDGMLWIGTGDGGGSGDPLGTGQSLTTLLGKMLRIDVDAPSDGLAYGIPPDNPFASSSTMRREIWGWGLRNPWRYSFDRATNALYVADVGQNFFEEVHVVSHTAASVNYGWNIMEGKHCYAADRCDTFGLNRPVIDYDHTEGCSVTGGYVYRGSRIPSIYGRYFYSDVCSGFLRSFRFYRGAVIEQRDWDIGDLGSVTSFGEGSDGELYIVSGEGTVFRLIPGPHLTLKAMQLRSGTARNQSN
jgi:glucose/arabinose dehydrogenase